MKRIHNYWAIILIVFTINSCKSQNKDKQMEEIIQQELALTHNYTHRPVFGAQVNKSGCKLILEIEGAQDYRFTENKGESMMLPLNVLLLNAGKKTAIIKVYPRDGEEYLTMYANANITFYRAEDKDTHLQDYRKIGEFTLPQGLAEKKLPYYEARISFDADVPFTYDKELAKARDLRQIPDIEKKIVSKYEQLRQLCVEYKKIELYKELVHSSGKFYNVLYNNTYNEIKKNSENTMGIVQNDPRIVNRELLPIENYTIQYYADGKIIALWQKNLRPMLYIKARIKNNEGEERDFEGGDPLFLYMPEGSNELKVW